MIDKKRRIINIASLVSMIIASLICIGYLVYFLRAFLLTFEEVPDNEARVPVALAYLVMRVFSFVTIIGTLGMLTLIIVGLCLFKKPKACVFLIIISAIFLPTTSILLDVGIENRNAIYIFLGILMVSFGIANLLIQIYRTRLINKKENEIEKTPQ